MRCWPRTSGSPPWAQELRKAGLDGGMDELRARAFLDLVLGKDSRPRAQDTEAAGPPAGAGPVPGAGRPGARRAGSPGRSR